MKWLIGVLALTAACSTNTQRSLEGDMIEPNQLTAEEQEQGFRLLFDGRTLAGWRGYGQSSMPAGWDVVDGAITRVAQTRDIITVDQFDNFDLRLEWMVAPGGNSGIFYRAKEGRGGIYEYAPEYQVLDDARHADGQSPLTSAASNFALYPVPRGVVRPAGEWNSARIVVNGNHVEHWLNGVRVVQYELGSEEWKQRVAASKFRAWPEYGLSPRGHIGLQEHGDRVAFRSIRIRQLSPPAQDPPSAFHALGRARQALTARDTAAAQRNLEIAVRMGQNIAVVQYEAARMYAQIGDSLRMLNALQAVVPLGSSRDPMRDSAFVRFHGSGALAAVADAIARAAAPLIASSAAFQVPDPDLIPESIAYDGVDGMHYIGSMGKRKIVRRTRNGATGDFIDSGREGLGEVIGMRVHPARRELWVNSWSRDSTAPQYMRQIGGWAAVYRYELPSGRLLARYDAPRDGKPHLFNDIVFAADGSAYITDSHGGAVYRIAGDSLALWYQGDAGFLYPNGIALSPDGARLYVAHLGGIFVWTLPGQQPVLLAAPADVPTGYIDGLYLCGRTLIGIQNSDAVRQVVALELDDAGTRIRAGEVLERQHPQYALPTTGVVIGGALYYIANSQLDRLQQDGSVRASPAAPPTTVLRLPLARAQCR